MATALMRMTRPPGRIVGGRVTVAVGRGGVNVAVKLGVRVIGIDARREDTPEGVAELHRPGHDQARLPSHRWGGGRGRELIPVVGIVAVDRSAEVLELPADIGSPERRAWLSEQVL